ncbi:MAG: glycosyltransferase family 39 protein [Anaerolineales bacterium]
MLIRRRRDLISLGLRLVLVLGSVAYILAFAYIAIRRMPYPFELEWMEGGSLVQVARLLKGQMLYVQPSLEFVPFIYPPLYFYVSAAFAKVVGIGFLPLRLVSFVASLASFIIIFLIVRRETRSIFSSIVAAGLYAATFHVSGAWFDIARVDALGLLFLLAGIYFVGTKSAYSQILAGVSFALAFFTKQTFLLASLPVLIYIVWKMRWRCLSLVGTTGILVVTANLLLNRLSNGWYGFYVWYLPSRHILPLATLLNFSLVEFWPQDLLAPMGLACLVALTAFLFRRAEKERGDPYLYLAAAVGMVGTSWLGTLNVGGYSNVLLPAYAGVSILAGVGLGRVTSTWAREEVTTGLTPARFAQLACVIQFVALLYPLRSQIPTQADLAAGQELVREIRDTPGDVFIPFHGYLAMMAGKPSFAHQIAVAELEGTFGGGPTDAWQMIYADFETRLQARSFGAVILDSEWLWGNVGTYYPNQTAAFGGEAGFYPVTGWRTRPETIFRP